MPARILLPLFSVIDHVRAVRLKRILPAWRSPEIGVFAMFPSRHFLDAKTCVWLEWVQSSVAPKVTTEAAHLLEAPE